MNITVKDCYDWRVAHKMVETSNSKYFFFHTDLDATQPSDPSVPHMSSLNELAFSGAVSGFCKCENGYVYHELECGKVRIERKMRISKAELNKHLANMPF